MENKEYTISSQTMRDIMDKIPQDKWSFVIRDMEAMLNQTSAVLTVIEATSNALELGLPVSELVQMKDEIVWIDDGKCENEIRFTDEDSKEIGSIKFEGEK